MYWNRVLELTTAKEGELLGIDEFDVFSGKIKTFLINI